MRHILCYGDSNTWGYTPGTGVRFSPQVRWPGVVRRLLGESWEVLEEGLNGRTTVYNNPMSDGRDGGAYLLPCLLTHKPLDLVVLMLGTNDLRFTDAWGAAEGAAALVKKIRLYSHLEESSPIFPEGPRILLISPIRVHPVLREREVIYHWREYPAKSEAFSQAYAAVARELGVDFLDAADHAGPSETDGLHMEAADHAALGEAVAGKIREIFADGLK